jgi:Transcriptional regulators of sugar metabolism
MKRAREFVENRRKSIMKMIEEMPKVKVEELAYHFQVSPMTIRRDLQHLEDKKKLVRFYGGATSSGEEMSKEMRELQLCRTKIAQYAASLVERGDSLFINTSKNAMQILEYIDKDQVTVMTNNGKAIHTNHHPGVSVILTGGELRYPKEAMVGEFAIRNLQKVYAKKAFIGCTGISPEGGITTEIANEVNINELMIERITGECYILADHRKIGRNSSFKTCGISKIKNLITDEKADPEVIKELRAYGVKVYQVPISDK